MDCAALAEKAKTIFTKLDDCGCGIISDKKGEYILLYGTSSEEVSDWELEIIEKWLKAETSMEKASVHITQA